MSSKKRDRYDTRKDPCRKNACMIQTCLKENNYQESECQAVFELMRECCRQHKKDSVCCEGIDIEPTYNRNRESSVSLHRIWDGSANVKVSICRGNQAPNQQ